MAVARKSAAQKHRKKKIRIQSLPNMPVDNRGSPRVLLPLTHFSAPVSAGLPIEPTVGSSGFTYVFSSIVLESERVSCDMDSCEYAREALLLVVGRVFCELQCR